MNLQEAHKRSSIGSLFQDNIDGVEIIFKRFGDFKSVNEIASGLSAAGPELRTQLGIALFFLDIGDIGLCEIARNLGHESRIAFIQALAVYFEIELEELH